MDAALKRAIRTFVQGFIGVFLAAVASGLLAPDTFPELDALMAVILAAIWGGVIAVLSWIQNELEDHGKVTSFLKD